MQPLVLPNRDHQNIYALIIETSVKGNIKYERTHCKTFFSFKIIKFFFINISTSCISMDLKFIALTKLHPIS